MEIIEVEEKLHAGTIYMIKSKIPGDKRVYIGQTIQKPAARWRAHRACLNKNREATPKLQNYYNKYGLKNLEFIVIASNIFGEELLNYYEKYYIKFYDSHKNGLNCTEGGSSCSDKCKKSVEIKDFINNKIYKFKSYTDCADFIGTKNGSIGKLITKEINIISNRWCRIDFEPRISSVISPEGKIFHILRVKRFCRENDLCPRSFIPLTNELILEYRGWRLLKNKDLPPIEKYGVNFELINSEGKIYKGNGINKAKRDLSLPSCGLGQLVRGQIPEYRGWKLHKHENNIKKFISPSAKGFKLINNLGEIKKFNTIMECCLFLNENIHSGRKHINKLINKEIHDYKGWMLHIP